MSNNVKGPTGPPTPVKPNAFADIVRCHTNGALMLFHTRVYGDDWCEKKAVLEGVVHNAYDVYMKLRDQPIVVLVIWTILLVAVLWSLFSMRWSIAFVSVATFIVTLLPGPLFHRLAIVLPTKFLAAITIFIFATLFLGEVFDFYERYWWWDILLHGGSAVGFGLIGFLFVFFMFEGDKYAAPPVAVAFVSFCFGVTIGVAWEIFEFSMDQIFDLNMQKSGLIDTMGDLIVDMIGASVGATAGFFFLKGRQLGGLSAMIDEFVSMNRRLYSKLRKHR